jgi:hypothetical protein
MFPNNKFPDVLVVNQTTVVQGSSDGNGGSGLPAQQIPLPVPISFGGTGSDTRVGALGNLGASPVNHKHTQKDITDLPQNLATKDDIKQELDTFNWADAISKD